MSSETGYRIPRIWSIAVVPLLIGGCGLFTGVTRETVPAVEAETETIDTEQLLETVQQLIGRGEYEEALAVYREVWVSIPHTPENRLLLARLLMLSGRFDEARDELTTLINDGAESAEVFYVLSLVEEAVGDQDAQRQFLMRVIEEDPDHADGLAKLAEIYHEEDAEIAETYYRRALVADPGNLASLLGLGRLVAEQGRAEEAFSLFERAIEIAPDYPFAYVDRAHVMTALGDLTGALSDLTTAIDLMPDYYWNYIDRGRLYLQNMKRKEAFDDFTTAISVAPEMFVAYVYRARMNFQNERYPEALQDYQKLYSLRPDYYFAYPPLGVLYYMEGEWELARDMFQKAIQYDFQEYGYHLLIALTFRKEKREEEAIQFLTDLLPAIPRESWYFDVARLLHDGSSLRFVENRVRDNAGASLPKSRMMFYLASHEKLQGNYRTAHAYLLDSLEVFEGDYLERRIAHWELNELE